MSSTLLKEDPLHLVIDLLADMIITFITQTQREVRSAVLYIMELEIDDQLDHEQTTEILGTADYRIVA